MSSPRGHPGSRSLGNVKVKGSIFPPLTRAINDNSRHYFQDHQLMVHGDGVGLSLTSRSMEKEDGQFSRQSMRPLTSKSDHGNIKLMEEIKDLQTKEKQQRNKIQSLHKIIEQLKAEIKTKDEDISAVNQKLQEIEDHYRLLYEDECKAHNHTKERLNELMNEVKEKVNLIEELKRKHEERMQEIKDGYESKILNLEEEKAREIADRDERIAKLKKNMADVLKGNSQERQQQLEELTKELGKMSEEANDLRTKLKGLLKNRTCDNCERMKMQIAKRDKKIIEHESTIKQLMALCQKFETQLMQQTILKECVDLVKKD